MRFVSLLPDTDATVTFGSCREQLSYLEETPYLDLESGVYPLRVSLKGEELLAKRFGFGEEERALVVILGHRGVSPPTGFLHRLRAHFEGQGHAFKENYAVQAAVLRGSAYLDPKKAYLRVFHGASATVPLTVHSGSQKASVNYAQATDFLPLEPGKRQIEISPQGLSAPITSRSLDLQAGTTTYIFLARDNMGKGKLETLIFIDPPSERKDR